MNQRQPARRKATRKQVSRKPRNPLQVQVTFEVNEKSGLVSLVSRHAEGDDEETYPLFQLPPIRRGDWQQRIEDAVSFVMHNIED